MKILIIGGLHHKNKEGLENILQYLKYEFKWGNINDIKNYDIIYSPSYPIDSSKYLSKKFIFGPHFSVFPDYKINLINNKHSNAIYIQPSKWASDVWINIGVEQIIPIKTFPFPVNTNKFQPININRDKVFIYFKRRKPEELNYLLNFLSNKNIEYRIFDYIKRYNEEDYLNYLQQSKYGIILDAHESQGFAIEEALSCNVPLLVWNTHFMSQEYGGNYQNIPCTTIPYWNDKCGEFFYKQEEFINTYNKFINNIKNYKPREYILENLSVEKCGEKFIDLIKNII